MGPQRSLADDLVDAPDPCMHQGTARARGSPDGAIVETAILYDPAAKDGPTEKELKTAWFQDVFGPSTRTAFPRIRMLSWFEWRKQESEVGRVIDWRLGSDPALARSLLDGVPDWLVFGS